MADADFDSFDAYEASSHTGRAGDPRDPGGFQKWVNGAGAITSVALIAGLGVWGYNLAVRDVRGVPVIQALEGPARVAPDNPGGELALHQGMAVNKIAADGAAGDPADRLTLAPRPEGLTDEDQPMGAIAPESDAAPKREGMGEVVPASDFAGQRPPEPLPDGPADRIAEPLVTEAIPASFAAPDVIPASIPGVKQSPRPLRRPALIRASVVETAMADDPMAEAAAAAVAAALAPPPALDIAPEALAEGTRLVQIGSFADEAEARLEWERTAARFGALMDGKRRVIEPAESGGEVFYRLRVEGFDDLDDARRFCAALKAENADCAPTLVR